MKKLFFIACFISCAHNATTLLPSQAESSVEQLVRIMMSNTNPKHQIPYTLTKEKNPNYQDVYNLAIKHPKLLKGIVHDGRTFAMLCVERGYADVLERLINEGYLVDLATPCNPLHSPDESYQTTVLHKLLSEAWAVCKFKKAYSEDYIALITRLTKLIISKYPDLLDIPLNGAKTARYHRALFNGYGANDLYDLFPDGLPQSSCKSNDNSVK